MGPTNIALVNYYRADQRVREAQARLDAATKDVRIQERRVNDLAEKHKLAGVKLKEAQAKQGALDLDLKTRDAHIDKLRTQQQNAKNNKEYQAFLIEINTEKTDRNKIEEEVLKLMEAVEKQQGELKDQTALLESERGKLESMRTQITDKISALQAEIDGLKPEREAAGSAVSPKAREQYEKLAERWEGEALSAIAKPDRRREEYMCTACHMDLVIDVYNKLHSRDDLIFCPSCRRILYIPDDLPPEVAIKKPPAVKRISATVAKKGESAPETFEQIIGRVLSKAQGESVQNAMAGGNDPLEFDVFVDGKPVGSYKGVSKDNFQRTAQFCLQESGLGGTVSVAEKGAEAGGAEAPAVEAPSADAPTSADASAGDQTPASTQST